LGQVTPIHHDRIDGFVANEHINWTDASSNFKTSGTFHLTTAKTPATAYDTGVTGQVAWDTSYIYVCTATNNWERAAIATWGDIVEYLLLETGDRILLETGDRLKLESSL
jgi:hypothetical protein